jgi:hypothetical protein
MALLAVLAVVIGLAIWWWQSGMVPFWESIFGDPTPPLPQRTDAAPERPTPAAPGSDSQAARPAVEYPLPPQVNDPKAKPLPPLDRSDPVVRDSLLGQMPGAPLARFVNMQDYVRRFVVTVDNLPRENVPNQLSVFQRVPDLMIVDRGADGVLTLSPRNYERYAPLVGFLESLSPSTVVNLYSRFYPLMDQEYKSLGHPHARFHDRVIFAIDDLLAAPTPTGPIELKQPRILYTFADPALQNLSAGQKAMVRLGPAQAQRLKQVLRRIRAQLLGQAVN